MANRLNHLIDAYRRFSTQSGDVVLATIIETQGSTYQKAGARMLISKDGEWVGVLSGGCFETDLWERSRTVFASGQAAIIVYDMRSPDDAIWGLGLGCNGAAKIMLQLLKADEHFYPLNVLAEAVENDRGGVLMTVIESEYEPLSMGRSIFWGVDDFVNPPPVSMPGELMTAAQRTLQDGKPRIETHLLEGRRISVFYDPIRPLPHLLIVGAGADAIPLAHCAKSVGWRVIVVDHRPAYIKPERFRSAERLIYCLPQDLTGNLQLDRFDAMVLMTHSFEYDARYLKFIADSRIPFVGLLGPGERKNRLLDGLGDKALKIADRVFGPVGLDIGAETPEEVALSIMAGIMAARNRRHGDQLTLHKVAEHA